MLLQACKERAADYDQKRQLRRMHVVAGLLLPYFIDPQHCNLSGIALSHHTDQGARAGVADAEAVAALTGVELQAVFQSIREYCRRRCGALCCGVLMLWCADAVVVCWWMQGLSGG